jgi:ATP-dependent protease HslVU (ClpYQ) peptidase subunit
MTCIAALVDEKGVGHIACDSLSSYGQLYKNSKIFEKGNMLIGYTSSYRMGQLLEHSLNMPERKDDQSIENYMYVDFINAVRELLKNNGQMLVDKNIETIGFFLIVTDGSIFKMQDDLSLLEATDGFDACGSGEAYARAVLDLLKKQGNLAPKEMLTVAIDTAAKYVASVGGEVKYLSNGPSE